jgi:Uma2 family endonuclease
METMILGAHAGPMTRADLDALPDDGYRRELIDGVLIVSPSPSYPHQDVVLQLAMLLTSPCPSDLKVLIAPFDVVLADDTVMIPDLLVARREDITHDDLPVAPVLAVEVLSPSTRRFDLMTKRSRYEAAGTTSYWVVDPVDLTLTAWDLTDGTYTQVAHVTGDQEYAAAQPFPVTVTPSRLRD